MSTSNLQKKKINTEIERAVNSGFVIDTHNDANLFDNQVYSWDDLNRLKEDLGRSILEFVSQVNMIIVNPEIISNLKEKTQHFNNIVNIFFSDINNFSNKVKDLREQHEYKTGKITNLQDFNDYNRIAITYQSLYTELAALVTPTLSDIMLTVAEIKVPVQAQTQQTGV